MSSFHLTQKKVEEKLFFSMCMAIKSPFLELSSQLGHYKIIPLHETQIV